MFKGTIRGRKAVGIIVSNAGALFVAWAVFLGAQAVNGWTEALAQNTAQLANVAACRADGVSIEAGIDAGMLTRMSPPRHDKSEPPMVRQGAVVVRNGGKQ